MLPCLYDEKQHKILSGGDILAFCKKVAPTKDRSRFFLYHHQIAGTFVLARWASDRAMGIFTDFLHIGHSLDEFTREKAAEFRRRLYAPLQATDMARTINQSSRDYDSMQQEEAAENQEAMERRRKDN